MNGFRIVVLVRFLNLLKTNEFQDTKRFNIVFHGAKLNLLME